MLFKLSLKNISKSIKDYAIYFFTLILGVAIFYVFNAIDDQSVMMKVSSTTAEIIKLMTNVLSGVSVFVSIILAFLIVYASRFLIKRRNKEFGVYLTLGMSKKKISLILFIETLIIGIVSLVVGLGIGFLLSQLMSILVANMFEADLTRFQFVFSTNACIKTLIYFSIMYFVVMIFNTINISKCKLIDLMHSNKKSEKIKLIKYQKDDMKIEGDTIVGTFKYSRNFGYVIPDDKKTIGTDIFISKKDIHKAKNNQKVVVQVTKMPAKDKKAEGKIIEILGNIDQAGIDMMSLVREYDLPYEFPEPVLIEAKGIKQEIDA